MALRYDPYVRAAVFALIAVGFAACSEAPEDNWYEYSSDVDQRKQEYVRQAMEVEGVSEMEAKRDFGLQYSIELTGRRDPVEVTREDLDRMMIEAEPSNQDR